MSQQLKEPNKIRVKYEDLEDVAHWGGGYLTMHFEGKPFNGFAVLDYFPDGSVEFEEEYRDGNHMGWDNEYHENGVLKETTLNYGETTLFYYEYDQEGEKIHTGKLVSKETLVEFNKNYNLLDEEFLYILETSDDE